MDVFQCGRRCHTRKEARREIRRNKPRIDGRHARLGVGEGLEGRGMMDADFDINGLASRLRAEARKHTGDLHTDLVEASKVVDWYVVSLSAYHAMCEKYRAALKKEAEE